MRDELVAIDLETTGLNPTTDDIIEIGAVRMKEGQVIEEFSTFINPGNPIPPHVTSITGITSADVANAPTIQTVLPKLSAFIGNAPVLAHNLSLDMGFLQQRYGIVRGNTRIDTYDLASVLLPSAARYNLSWLVQSAGIVLENAHRALDDARAAGLLYWWLWQKVLALPHTTLQEISAAARNIEWDAAAVFTAALRESKTSTRDQQLSLETDIFDPPPADLVPLQQDANVRPIDLDAISRVVTEDGALAQVMPEYEARPQQAQMARAVAEALNTSDHLVVEAGTGAGKSLGYLIPSMLWAEQNNKRVVVSTYTLHLQDQLLQKDLPVLRQALKSTVSAVVMKGRANYLCPRRLAAARRRPPMTAVEVRTLAKIFVWLLESKTGDRSEINLRGPVENTVWQRLSAQDEGCSLNRCETVMRGVCPFYKARKAAEAAQIVVVNHALLMADALSENDVLPDYRYLVVDEAHHLEEATTNGLTFHIDRAALARRLTDLGNAQRGLLSELLYNLRGHVTDKVMARFEAFVRDIGETVAIMDTHISRYFEGVRTYLVEAGAARGEYVTLVRVDQSERAKNSFVRIQSDWNTVDELFEVVSGAMFKLTGALGRLAESGLPGYDDLLNSLESAGRYLEETRTTLKQFSLEPQSNMIYWVSMASGGEGASIHAAPLSVGGLLDEHLWKQKDSVVLTSATLRAQDNFDFIRQRLKVEDARTMEVGSPFNYRESTLLYVPDDIPEPNDRQGYQRAVERGIIELAAALDGRVLVLFTSYAQLRQTAQAIAPRLALGNIAIYDQSEGANRQAMLDGFKGGQKAVLMGTKSFWEGVDIPGDTLSALVITRLPFAVPTDPIFASRSEGYSDSFNEYALPDAVLRFRQGFGRLIRTKNDRGVVTIFDSRILSKRYGTQFLEALPECTTKRGSLDKLADAAKQWIDRKS
ncbi:MAG: helicase C-terminal domain-containing protein [bacterium]|nr:helicase C-terminal domain-containing protein [bacterium]